jgi:hypothetical protein
MRTIGLIFDDEPKKKGSKKGEKQPEREVVIEKDEKTKNEGSEETEK